MLSADLTHMYTNIHIDRQLNILTHVGFQRQPPTHFPGCSEVNSGFSQAAAFEAGIPVSPVSNRRKWAGSKSPTGYSVFSKSRTEGNSEHVGGRRREECWISRTSLYFRFWHTFPDRKPMFSPRKYQMTLIRSVYETLPVMMPGCMQMGWKTLESFIQIRTGKWKAALELEGWGKGRSEAHLPPACLPATSVVSSTESSLSFGSLSFRYRGLNTEVSLPSSGYSEYSNFVR